MGQTPEGGWTLPGPARGVPCPGTGGTLPGVPWRGVPCRGVPRSGIPGQVRTGGTLLGEYPARVPWSGTPPPPGQIRIEGEGGYPGRTTEGVLNTRQAVCLLCSRRRTFLFKTFLGTHVLFVGPLIPLFWTSGDICSGFQSQGGSLACMLPRMRAMDSSNSPLVRHLPTS